MQEEKNTVNFFWVLTINHGPKTKHPQTKPFEFFPFDNAAHGVYDLIRARFPSLDVVREYFSTLRYFDISSHSGGSFFDLGTDGLTKVLYRKTTGIVYIDFNTSEKLWHTQDMESFKKYYAGAVQEGLNVSMERLKKNKGEVLNEMGFMNKCRDAIAEYLETSYALEERRKPLERYRLKE